MWISASGSERERSLASNVMDCPNRAMSFSVISPLPTIDLIATRSMLSHTEIIIPVKILTTHLDDLRNVSFVHDSVSMEMCYLYDFTSVVSYCCCATCVFPFLYNSLICIDRVFIFNTRMYLLHNVC